MFCPECGKEENQSVPFCRACGTDLRRVRVAVETPDNIAVAAMSARDEIGRAVAAKIRETQDTYELKKVAEDILPEIEKFLESPEEKRLRKMRIGMMLLVIGLGVSISLSLIAVAAGDPEILVFAALGFVSFLLGLAFVLNGKYLTVPRAGVLTSFRGVEDRRSSEKERRQGRVSALRGRGPRSGQTEEQARRLPEDRHRCRTQAARSAAARACERHDGNWI